MWRDFWYYGESFQRLGISIPAGFFKRQLLYFPDFSEIGQIFGVKEEIFYDRRDCLDSGDYGSDKNSSVCSLGRFFLKSGYVFSDSRLRN